MKTEIIPSKARGCVPWIPPLFVSDADGLALEAASAAFTGGVAGAARGRDGGSTASDPLQGIVVREQKGRPSSASWTKNGAKYVSGSGNTKIGAMDATWVSIMSTCVDCTWKTEKVCYAMGGRAQFVVNKLDASARAAHHGSLETTRDEVAVIDAAYHTKASCETGAVPPGTTLRVHASGDTSTVEGARLLGAAISRWKRRGGMTAYTYTHAWRRVPRKAFGPDLSVLASIDRAEDVTLALAQGYGSVTVIVTEESWAQNFSLRPDGDLVFKKFTVAETRTDLSFVPCPAQYPVDAQNHREASRWKALYVGRRLGLFQPLEPGEKDSSARRKAREDGIREAFALFIPKTYECGSEPLTHLPGVREKLPVFTPKQRAAQKKLKERMLAAGFPDPGSVAFLRMMRKIEPGEKSTCEACGLCFDDQSLGRKAQAVAFRPDFSGGIVRTQALLKKRDTQARIAAR
jgi:hypothetical protein